MAIFNSYMLVISRGYLSGTRAHNVTFFYTDTQGGHPQVTPTASTDSTSTSFSDGLGAMGDTSYSCVVRYAMVPPIGMVYVVYFMENPEMT